MAKKPEPIVRLAAQTARQIFANSGNYMAFLTTAAHMVSDISKTCRSL